MSARWAGRWCGELVESGCICRRAGLRTMPGARRRVCRRRDAAYRSSACRRDGVGPGDAGEGHGTGPSKGLGHLKAGWVAGDDAFGMSSSFRPFDKLRRTGGPGDVVRAGRSGRHHGMALGAGIDQSGISMGSGAPANPSSGLGSAGPWSNAVMNCRVRLGGR